MSITVPAEPADDPPRIPTDGPGGWLVVPPSPPEVWTWHVMTGYTMEVDAPPRTREATYPPNADGPKQALADVQARWAAGARDLCIEATDPKGITYLGYVPVTDTWEPPQNGEAPFARTTLFRKLQNGWREWDDGVL